MRELRALVAAALAAAPVVIAAPAITRGPLATVPAPATARHATLRCPALSWPLQLDAEQTLVVPVDESDVAAAAPEVAAGAGGIVLFGSVAPRDLAAQLRAVESGAAVRPFVMADEEGGAVQRLADLAGSLPSARQMGATMSPAAIRALALQTGRRLLAAGVTMDLAPVLDVDGGSGPSLSDADGTRSFSASEPVAAAAGLAFAAGLEAAGVVPVVKHFPGLGGASGNTDLEPASTLPLAQLARGGLLPFEQAVRAKVPAVMVSNATVPGLTSVPASVSHAAIAGLLRGTAKVGGVRGLGFRGLIVTDSLSAKALADAGFGLARAAVAAIASGADLLLFNADPGQLRAVTGSLVAAEVGAVQQHRLGAATLRQAARAVLAAKRVAGC